ncbi:MAG: tRNA dihydrouridine synthase DusB [Bacteroidales bacterium]|jgi:nifR3 family TIM-barrel protein|nr:tRNA dihydrouridine synthase DusB [Bacteroidales bacterium]
MKIGNIEFTEYPLILAPLEDITDLPFRLICKQLGADLMYTEFISSEGLIRDAQKSVVKLELVEEERPMGIQIFGHDTDSMIRATEIAEQAKPDLIDINFGCPVRKVTNKGAGAAMLRDVPKMIEITRAVVNATKLPVTVKTRLGWDDASKNIVEVAEQLQDTGIAALTIHGRTRAQLYSGIADWTLIGKVKNNPKITIPIIGNGDITGPEIAEEMKDRYGVDGIMVGRAAIGYPWIFREIKQYFKDGTIPDDPNVQERVEVARQHLLHSVEYKGERRGMFEMRKHYGNYFKGFPYFKPFKIKLMETEEHERVLEILDEIKDFYA